MLLVSNL